MSARVHLDIGSLERTTSGAVVGWIDLGDASFPEAGWYDFPVTLLTWWIEALRDLISQDSDETTILFMDGAYEIRLERTGQATVATGLHSGSPTTPSTETIPEHLLASALACAKALLAEMGSESAKGADIDDLARLTQESD